MFLRHGLKSLSMSKVNNRLLHTFPLEMGFLPKDALRYADMGLVCVGQTGLNEQDERAWLHDNAGRWHGPAPTRTVPANLRAIGASVERMGRDAADLVHRLPSGSRLSVDWEVMEAGMVTPAKTWRLHISNTLAESVIVDTVTTAQRFDTDGALPDGSYLVACRLALAEQVFKLPATGYTRNDARFKYGPNPEDYWDFESNLGKLPPVGHASYGKRAEIVAQNLQKDKPEWADFIIGAEPVGGEWSARLVIIGDGALQISPSFLPPWGPVMYSIGGLHARSPLYVDPLARTGDKLRIARNGDLLMAGQRSTPSGLVAALWRWDYLVDDWFLLGVNENPSTGMCECALANHGPTEILERPDGSIKVLTKCSKLRYAPEGAVVETRLPGSPESTHGHPGGQSLRLWEGREYHTTESFGETFFTDASGNRREQFYDVLVIEGVGVSKRGPGTAFHGRDDMALWFGRLWGVMQDKATSDPEATQYITWFDGQDWSFDTLLQYPASAFSWQRLISLESGEQNALVAFGKRAQNEERLIGVGLGGQSTAQSFTWASFPYAVRSASVSAPEEGEIKVLVMPGRKATEEAIDSTWHLIETTAKGNTVPLVCDGACSCFCVPFEYLLEQGIEVEDMPPFLVWFQESCEWRFASEAPEDGRPYVALTVDEQTATACYCYPDGSEWSGLWPGETTPCQCCYDADCNALILDLFLGVARIAKVDPETGAFISWCDEKPRPVGVEAIILRMVASEEKPVYAIQARDAGRDGIIREYAKEVGAIWLRVDSDLPPNDLSSYKTRVEYDIWTPLPKSATSAVDVLFYAPTGTGLEDIVAQFFARN